MELTLDSSIFVAQPSSQWVSSDIDDCPVVVPSYWGTPRSSYVKNRQVRDTAAGSSHEHIDSPYDFKLSSLTSGLYAIQASIPEGNDQSSVGREQSCSNGQILLNASTYFKSSRLSLIILKVDEVKTEADHLTLG